MRGLFGLVVLSLAVFFGVPAVARALRPQGDPARAAPLSWALICDFWRQLLGLGEPGERGRVWGDFTPELPDVPDVVIL